MITKSIFKLRSKKVFFFADIGSSALGSAELGEALSRFALAIGGRAIIGRWRAEKRGGRSFWIFLQS
jgi:hypothetical protein